jgi:hypothetical protein
MAYKETKTKNSSRIKKISGAARTRKNELFTRQGVIKGVFGVTSETRIAMALTDLKNEGYSNVDRVQTNVLNDSETLLSDLGFVPVELEVMEMHGSNEIQLDKDFSLLKTTNVDTTIENSKIFDPDMDNLTPDFIFVVDKFKSETDPFYELDDVKPDAIDYAIERQKVLKKKKLIKVAIKLSNTVRRSRNKMLPKTPKQGINES